MIVRKEFDGEWDVRFVRRVHRLCVGSLGGMVVVSDGLFLCFESLVFGRVYSEGFWLGGGAGVEMGNGWWKSKLR